MKLSKLFAGSSPQKKNIFHMAQHDHMFSFVGIQQSKQQVGLKDYRLKQSKVHCVYIARTPLLFLLFFLIPVVPLCLFPGTPYFLTLSCKTCNNWQAPHLEKRVTRSMISYTTTLWYTNMQISFHTHCS